MVPGAAPAYRRLVEGDVFEGLTWTFRSCLHIELAEESVQWLGGVRGFDELL